MNTILLLLESLEVSEFQSEWPGYFGMDLKHPNIPKGFELQLDNEVIKKEPKSFKKEIIVNKKGAKTISDIYDNFIEEYNKMLLEVKGSISHENEKANWIMSSYNLKSLDLGAQNNKDFMIRDDLKNGIQYAVQEFEEDESYRFVFHFIAWPCFDPIGNIRDKAKKQAEERQLNKKLELIEENGKSELTKEEIKEKLSENFKVVD